MRAVFVSTRLRAGMRFGVPFLILAGCALALRDAVSADVVLALPDQLSNISTLQWVLAAVLTMGSFLAVAQYDRLAHKALKTGILPNRARASGAIGISLGQTLGFGLVTGALARWRMLPDLTLVAALRLSAFVSMTFVVAWGLVTAAMCLTLPAPGWTFWPALGAMTLAPALALALFWWPQVRILGRDVPLPTLPLAGAILGWTVLDTVLAAGTLFVLLPAETIGFAPFFPLFLIALGTGLVSNTPGGVGPFELVLLAAAPVSDPAPLLAAILGYRLIYYALPAAFGAVMMLRPFAPTYARPVAARAQTKAVPRSEAFAILQNNGSMHEAGNTTLPLWPTGQTLTLFTDPITGSGASALQQLKTASQDQGCVPFVYKSEARMAAHARAAGWRVLHLADDALIDLDGYTLDIPARRTLRRKLRAAQKAGIMIRTGAPLPTDAMARIDSSWQATHGQARGGSMGRYCPKYIAHQWVGCAYREGALIAFVTAHTAQDEWCLDIMRHDNDLPDGTMHALVHTAISAAQRAGTARFNLAATPACPNPSSAFWRWAAFQIATRAGASGLRQFKSSFAPRWAPRYAAARSWGELALGLADIARAIHNPPPLTRQNTNPTHNRDENYEVASSHAA
ncbi:MAG: phosphatidylglycerol lysyltransferase domain-containing protein [Pseudomonadota bacterium]